MINLWGKIPIYLSDSIPIHFMSLVTISRHKDIRNNTAFPWFLDALARHRALGAKDFMEIAMGLFLANEERSDGEEIVRVHCNTMQIGFAIKHPLKLLIVEDNKINSKVLVKMLERLGYQPGIAINGEECLAVLKKDHYDMVFMDLQMPVMDGFEAARHLLERSCSSSKPIFISALTANADIHNKQICDTIGLHDFVAKPVSPKEIMEVIIRGYHWLQEQGINEA